MAHNFGAGHTEWKLAALREYMNCYRTVLKHQNFRLWYIDAYAGTGERGGLDDDSFFDETEREMITSFEGSARIALDHEPGFDHYVFIESKRRHIEELRSNISGHPRVHQTKIIHGKADDVLIPRLGREIMPNPNDRGLIFLDPYGCANASLLRAIAAHGRLDCLILFGIQATKRELAAVGSQPGEYHERTLDRWLGSPSWRDHLKQPSVPEQDSLFDLGKQEKADYSVGYAQIAAYYTSVLKSIFPAVCDDYRELHDPSFGLRFTLHFAVANPAKSAQTLALKLATSILAKSRR